MPDNMGSRRLEYSPQKGVSCKIEMMRPIFTILFFLFTLSCFSQTGDTLKKHPDKIPGFVSFITRLNIANATKDGIYLNRYVVNISYEQAKRLNGKKIRVSGKVTILEGLKNLPGDELRQGRQEDTQYINSPKIVIIKR